MQSKGTVQSQFQTKTKYKKLQKKMSIEWAFERGQWWSLTNGVR